MKIKQVEIFSHNLIETEKFYVELLGVKIYKRTDSSISFIIGNSKLMFRKTDLLKPVYHLAFNIPKNQLYAAEKWISSKISVIEFEDKPIIDFPNWNAKSIYFFDNNGNVLEFIARNDLENQSDTVFDSSGILSISEIGFVTGNVKAFAEKLILENEFAFFNKQVQRDDFSVIGDDDGLLILVNPERNWFPTDIKAESFGIKVSVENNGKHTELEIE